MIKIVAVLLTVFNRREKTLRCLQNLYAQQLPEGIVFEVYMVDDGCTDGTPQAVKEQFPSVQIIKGSGNLYWNRGMHLAWKTAAQTKAYDFYLWLNDDTFIAPDTLTHVLECSDETNNNALICGFLSSEKDESCVTYGGRSKGVLLKPNGALQETDTVNGNVVLVPKIIYDSVGMLDPVFPHAIGDFDYGLRVQKEGFGCYTTKKFIGTCESNPKLPKWCYATTPFKERIKALYSPLGNAHPKYFFIYEKRNFGIVTAIKHYITIHLRVLFPKLWM
ncbi:glycosyltransferase family 2 protein [uncultured Zobellia sp.]|uniref:glycosyltransferase family 2 protein n=1 Tax=uncultured Zobellia sp. TaxID=255433 RepID=UPI002592A809|nr:glycosyltransferase family 2 protein [uncultured Zobellia sp.]